MQLGNHFWLHLLLSVLWSLRYDAAHSLPGHVSCTLSRGDSSDNDGEIPRNCGEINIYSIKWLTKDCFKHSKCVRYPTNYVVWYIGWHPFYLFWLLFKTNSLKFPSKMMQKKNGRKTVAFHEPPNRPFLQRCHCWKSTGVAAHTYYWSATWMYQDWVALAMCLPSH